MKLICDGGITPWNEYDTEDAIMLSKNIGYIDGVKLDVRASYDNILVLSRYEDLRKNTLSKNKVGECSYNYLKKVKFPSHIFKYFIPTLEEILKKYNNQKIIVLELYPNNNLDNYLAALESVVSKYHYPYYFMSKNNRLLDALKNKGFNRYGQIIDENLGIKVIYDFNLDDEVNFNDDILLITSNPIKIRKKLLNSTNNAK